ncbi:MAG: hypothetical protein ACLTSZ_06430 [Lachnospiraceae bacterium]
MQEKEKSRTVKHYLVQGVYSGGGIESSQRSSGMIYRFPLTNTLGNEGKQLLYSTANEVYNIVLMISSFVVAAAGSLQARFRAIHMSISANAHRVFLRRDAFCTDW